MSDWSDPRYKPTEETSKGFMTEEHTVWCGRCSHWNQFPGTKKEVAEQAKKDAGWFLSSGTGWVCSQCAAKFGLRKTNSKK